MALSVVVGILVVLFGTNDQGTRIFLTSITITIGSFSMFLNGIFFEKMAAKALPFIGFILTPVCAALSIVLTWKNIDYRPVGTALLLLGANFFLLPVAIFYERRKKLSIALPGFIGAIVATAFLIMQLWDAISPGEEGEKIALSFYILALGSFYLSLILLVKVSAKFKWAAKGVQVVAWAWMATAIFAVWIAPEHDDLPGALTRLLIIEGILIAAFTILMPIFHFMGRGEFKGEGGQVAEIDEEISRLKAKIEELEAKKLELS